MSACDKILNSKKIFLTGGTGSLGKAFLLEVLSKTYGTPDLITVFSRDEAKQFFLRSELENNKNLTESSVYEANQNKLRFVVGDVRDYSAVKSAMRGHDLVVHAAALKQVPSCEIFPTEAMNTNCIGAHNIVRATQALDSVKKCVFISTDKAAKPTNAMGITKALQEKIFIAANSNDLGKKYVGVRYGNVIASRGSVIPIFANLIKNREIIPITHVDMTRFLLTLPQAVETIMCAIEHAISGEIIVPNAISARVVDIVEAISGRKDYPTKFIGIRPGEKLDEIMISIEEAVNLRKINNDLNFKQEFFAICPRLEFYKNPSETFNLGKELSSHDNILSTEQISDLLKDNGILVENS